MQQISLLTRTNLHFLTLQKLSSLFLFIITLQPSLYFLSMAKHFSSSFPALFLFLLQSFLTVSSVLLLKKHQNHNSNNNAHHRLQANQSSCDLFTGSWIHDNSYYPSYQSSCSIIDPQFNCQLYGRPDTNYLNYRWQPDNCQIPRFDGIEFLTKMRGKSMMFVGDSIGRSQYQSLICMILSSGLSTSSPTEYSRGDTFSTFRFLDYGVTISFYKAVYLVDIDAVQGRRVLKLDEIRGNANAWAGFDVLSFNTGHWWTHTGSSQGWDLMESGGTMYQDMDRLVALERALRTWAKWIDTNVDTSKTRVFFQGISPTHENPSVWNAGATSSSRNCYGETTPIISMPGAYSDDQMKVTLEVLSSMNSPPFLLDITLLSAMRKDAHPSIYSGDLTPGQRASPDRSADCSHWCLPGLPDTWNQLFYTAFFYLHY